MAAPVSSAFPRHHIVTRQPRPTFWNRLLPAGSTGLSRQQLARVARLLQQRRREVVLVLVFSAMAAATLLLVPLWVEQLVGQVLLSQDLGRILQHLLLGLLLFMGVLGSELGRELYSARLANRSAATMRQDLYDALINTPWPRLQTLRTGELIGRISNDVEAMSSGLQLGVLTLIPNLMVSIGLLMMMLVQSWGLLLLTLLLISPLALVSGLLLRRIRRHGRQAQSRIAALNSAVDETVRGMQEIKSGGQERRMSQWFAELNASTLNAREWLDLFRALNPAVVSSETFITIGVLVLLCSWLVFEGHLGTSALTVFVTSLLLILTPLQRLSRSLGHMSRLSAVLDRLEQLHGLPREPVADPGLPQLPPLRGEITLQGVNFRYHRDFALLDIDLHIAPGETVALIGPSGSGKSTLIRVLLRFLQPNQGRILLDGLDVSRYRIDSLRRQIALVPQEPTIFDASLEDNLRFARPDADAQALREAAIAAQVDGFARELEQGYATPLGQFGNRLSAGQRQRIAIARAFLQDPAILIMDEPTSALDRDTERLLSDTLAHRWAERTLLIVAHRPSTMRIADRILVMEGGRLRPASAQEVARIHASET
jgi:ABC-type multidrug transport system fused ATPase/permease subunit